MSGKENFVSKVIHLGKEKLFSKGNGGGGFRKSSPIFGGYKGGLAKSLGKPDIFKSKKAPKGKAGKVKGR